jgi:hypothetical protein
MSLVRMKIDSNGNGESTLGIPSLIFSLRGTVKVTLNRQPHPLRRDS